MDLIKWNNIFVLMASETALVSEIEIEELNSQKEHIADELLEWASSFDNEVDEEGERTSKSCDLIRSLAERFDNNKCVGNDYLNVLFHIWQINQGEDAERISFK